MKSGTLVKRKTGRSPTTSARNPPMRGPSNPPAIPPVDRVPSAQPLFSFGVWEATIVIPAEMNPDTAPMTRRKN